ncbi:carotenoid oxygenase family protein [Actinosynnema sp. NPDC020468]|uniref:carotenoid oxygenase family protein n=1 Tax=Actinosynnema sp. NPDC020468 TaxID=3154488 RepID=UPI00340857C5
MTTIEVQGYWTPVPDEIDAVDLEVTGALPAELTGRYFRNGPNPLPGETETHRFVGHGMIHGVRLREGRAEWYRNRWVRTRNLDGAPRDLPDGSRDRTVGSANTHVVHHAGRVLALLEGTVPYELSRELDTIGPCDFGGRLTGAMTAHPKEDPATGELHFFGYSARPPFLTYHVLSPRGDLVRSRDVEVKGPTMMHDFAVTANHVVWLDLPLVFDLARRQDDIPYRWDDGYGARIGVMPKHGDGPVRWFEVDDCYVFHIGNAFEDADGAVVIDVVRYAPESFRQAWKAFEEVGRSTAPNPGPAHRVARLGEARLHRWTLDPATGRVHSGQRDDRDLEFPTINDSRTGLPNRYLYTIVKGGPDETSNLVVKFDGDTGASTTHDVGAHRRAGEAVFVPAADGRAEDEGWLIALAGDRAANRSELLVLDATDLSAPPVASVRLPRRVPGGFHGSWIPDA